jgi:RNase H-fold protein (predicted Holliday junction resolvase)
MMNNTEGCILGISVSTRGIGYAVLEKGILVSYGDKAVKKGKKNKKCVEKAQKLIDLFQPTMIVLEATSVKGSRRGPRIRALTKKLRKLAESNQIKAKLFSQKQIKQSFFENGEGTKHDWAEAIVQRFPELAHKLPSKRLPWTSENSRMGIFDAMALALMI